MGRRILFIVEGNREIELLNKICERMDKEYDIVSIRDNIYVLYNKLKGLDFSSEIVDSLREMNLSQEDREKLNNKFVSYYLLFDCDLHHREEFEKELPYDSVVNNNLLKLDKMASFFDNDTDPFKGKLFLNYPMVESYRDADSFFDEKYMFKSIAIDKSSTYKQDTGKTRIANIRIDTLRTSQIDDLTKMNIFKLNTIFEKVYGPSSLKNFRFYLDNLYSIQKEKIINEKNMWVINSTFFIPIDYFGEKYYKLDFFVENTELKE